MDMTLIALRSIKSELENRKENLSNEFKKQKNQQLEGEIIGTLVAINIVNDHIEVISKHGKND
ncbi:Uncharacterised protein [[Clostridium] sordellii]|uniref:hypothetical protein n=1 Tax=Paraclostridium sordellii TaxID=1505 RepID=UPI0005DE9968|nr:hypothetical protein [Paeniclostridium sordellii]CEP41605.1 Uncharacterised protein [[Clostridium] sordellii] [Paeniclostridium sordellii]